MLRKPNLIPPALGDASSNLNWHLLECELVTALYGGGTTTSVIDLQMPIRASAIRGQLRVWWRLLAEHKWKLGSTKAIREAEFSIWGGMGDTTGSTASQVFVRVTQPKDVNRRNLVKYDSKEIDLSYVLFPASNETDEEKKPHQLLSPQGITFSVHIAFSMQLDADKARKQQVIETLRWWANFGGLGARARRGLGAFRVTSCEAFGHIMQPLSADDVALAGCRLILRQTQSTDATKQLRTGIQKLGEFRQKPNLGRNPGQTTSRPGRSRWPEPDAIRRIQKTHNPNHAPEHPAGNVFPRILFGAPIIFHFVGAQEPRDVEVSPAAEGCDRIPSPVIIHPYYCGDKNGQPSWSCAALILPYQHLKAIRVTAGNRETFPVWNEATPTHIPPIRDHGGTDPIDAFANYFSK